MAAAALSASWTGAQPPFELGAMETLYAGTGEDVVDIVRVPAIKTPGKYLQSALGSLVEYPCDPDDFDARPGTLVPCAAGIVWRMVSADMGFEDRYVPCPLKGDFCRNVPGGLFCRIEWEGHVCDRAMIPVENSPKALVLKLREGKGYASVQKSDAVSRIETDDELGRLENAAARQARQIQIFNSKMQGVAEAAQRRSEAAHRQLEMQLNDALRQAREEALR